MIGAKNMNGKKSAPVTTLYVLQAFDPDEPEDARVHENDVRHHDERRYAGHRVPCERRAVLGELEVAVQRGAPEGRRQLCHSLPLSIDIAPTAANYDQARMVGKGT